MRTLNVNILRHSNPSESKTQHVSMRFQAVVDVVAAGAFEAFEAEILDCVAGDDGAVGHGAAEPAGGRTVVGAQVAHEAAGKTIARSGRIDHLASWEGGHHEDTVIAEQHGPMFYLIDDDE